MDRKRTGETIKRILKERKLTQHDIAGFTGLQQSVISEMMSGKRDPMTLAIKVSDLFNMKLDDIIVKESESNEDNTEKQNNIIISGDTDNARDFFISQSLSIEKYIRTLSDEIKEVRFIKQELEKDRLEMKRLQESLHDAIFALRSQNANMDFRHLKAADSDD